MTRLTRSLAGLMAAALPLAGCGDNVPQPPPADEDAAMPPPDAPNPPPPDGGPNGPNVNVIFFLGDGMGVATLTAARIYSVGEDGELTMDTLPETGWVRTYSHNSMVTDSAPSMSAYMTGVKMNNNVLSMSPETNAIPPGPDGANLCASNGPNGRPVPTFLEQARAAGLATGVVTTTRVTDATPAATYAHICNRNAENDVAAMLTPGGAGYNAALGDGIDVVFAGGRQHFLPNTVEGGRRTDGRDLTAELAAHGYRYVADKAGFSAMDPAASDKAIGLFTMNDMTYEADRDAAQEPSLSEMATKAVDILQRKGKPYFLMVEGGRIDHALHFTNARRAMIETVELDRTIKAVLDKVRATDPDLSHTLIVVTADHDHTMVLNGYAQRTGPTTATHAGILGLVKNIVTGMPDRDAEGMPYTILGFGNGQNRYAGGRNTATALDEAATGGLDYHQEAAVLMPARGETHGGTDVAIMAIGHGADEVHGFMTNTEVFGILHHAAGF